ncbi:MAG: hypothetical protein K2X47_13595 [Bdellovibrionales bacterium]|nr:hypothetical protein [Bdellovibrionales bacterium]
MAIFAVKVPLLCTILFNAIALLPFSFAYAGGCSSYANGDSSNSAILAAVERVQIEDMFNLLQEEIMQEIPLTRRNTAIDIPWTGPSIDWIDQSPHNLLSAASLRESRSDGNDAIFQIVAIFGQIAMEQGRRIAIASDRWTEIGSGIARLPRSAGQEQIKFLEGVDSKLVELIADKSLNASADLGADRIQPNQNWPVDGAPLPIGQIIYPTVRAILSGYQSTNPNVKNHLTLILTKSLPMFFHRGRQVLVDLDLEHVRRYISIMKVASTARDKLLMPLLEDFRSISRGERRQ